MMSSLEATSDRPHVSDTVQVVKPQLTTKGLAIHVMHALLVAVHTVALVAALKGWSIPIKTPDVSWEPSPLLIY